jgi:hypothetical protein
LDCTNLQKHLQQRYENDNDLQFDIETDSDGTPEKVFFVLKGGKQVWNHNGSAKVILEEAHPLSQYGDQQTSTDIGLSDSSLLHYMSRETSILPPNHGDQEHYYSSILGRWTSPLLALPLPSLSVVESWVIRSLHMSVYHNMLASVGSVAPRMANQENRRDLAYYDTWT